MKFLGKYIPAGFLAVLIKLGPKLFKLVKVFKGFKFLGAAGSMAAYSWLFSWQMAVAILVLLFVHESGHVWAMKKRGIKTKGIYFIPFIGGAAVADEEFGTRENEAFVAIMGPIWGLALSGAVFSLYFFTGQVMWAGIAAWMALINAFQFLPITPLDGGRIVKSICMSVRKKLGWLVMISGFGLALFLLFYLKIYLFVIIIPIGILDLLTDKKMKIYRNPLSGLQMGKYAASYVVVLGALLSMMFYARDIPGAKEALEVLM